MTTTTTTTVAALVDAKVQTLIEKNLTLLVEPVQHLGDVLGMDTPLSETSASFLTHLLGSDFTAHEGLAALIHDVAAGQEARLTALEDAVDAIMAPDLAARRTG